MKYIVPLITALFWLSPVQSATDSQLSAIGDMGRLNGVALQCRYTEQMQRIKMTLVLHLPKQRALGEWFEQTTSTSFMDFMNKGSSCPDSQSFVEQVDTAIKKIEIVFKQ
ncbi:MAG: hypothetical protein KAU21_07040 [Gammaproteobacteria bacterium]|nr:hypothetical protein [Gammaproteobacteria bacterium]